MEHVAAGYLCTHKNMGHLSNILKREEGKSEMRCSLLVEPLPLTSDEVLEEEKSFSYTHHIPNNQHFLFIYKFPLI